MKKKQFIEILVTQAEMQVDHKETCTEEVGTVCGATTIEYELDQVPRRGWGLDECAILLDVPLDLGFSDIGGYSSVVLIRVSEMILARFDVSYPEYCDDESDGDGYLEVYEWPTKEEACQGMDDLLRECRQSVVRTYLGPLLRNSDQLFGSDGWAKGITDSIGDMGPVADRVGVLRTVMESAQEQLRRETNRCLTEEVPLLASVELEWTNEFNDEGGTFKSLNDVTVTLVSGESHSFNGDDDLSYGCDEQLDEFENEVMEDLGIQFDRDDAAHREAFSLWMEYRLGVANFMRFWEALWGWIESNWEVSSCTFRGREEAS